MATQPTRAEATSTERSLERVLIDRQADILDRFTTHVAQAGLGAPGVEFATVKEHLDELTGEIARVWRTTGKRARVSVSVRAQLPYGRKHGKRRWQGGFDIKSVVIEYELLRRSIIESLLDVGVHVSAHEVEIVTQCVAVAVAEAVETFARLRSEELEREREVAEAERQRLTTTLGILPISLIIADAKGKIVQANQAINKLWGTETIPEAQRVDEYATFRAMRPDGTPLQPHEWGLARAAMHGETVHEQELDIMGFDGTRRTILNSAAPIRDTTGAVVGAVAVDVDISQLQRQSRHIQLLADAGKALASSLELNVVLRNVIEVLVPRFADWVLVDLKRDESAIETVAAVHADPAKRVMLDALLREERGRIEPGSLEQQVIERGVPLMVTEAQTPSPPAVDPLQLAKLDPYRPLGLSSFIVAPLVIQGQTMGAVLFVRGSREQPFEQWSLLVAQSIATRIALAVRNAQLYAQARAAVRMREELMAIVSHDLRNPLNIVIGTTAMLREQLQAGSIQSDLPIEKMLGAIERAGRKMNRLVTDLLDLRRIEAGRFKIELRQERARSLLQQAWENCRPLAEAKGILGDAMAEQELEVSCDASRILQVIDNLLDNAIKFTPRGGHITLSARQISGEVVFAIKDSGAGISSEQQARLFERFWKGADSRGTGFGLAIARGIVEAHGGRIWVESRLGEGSTFSFSLKASALR